MQRDAVTHRHLSPGRIDASYGVISGARIFGSRDPPIVRDLSDNLFVHCGLDLPQELFRVVLPDKNHIDISDLSQPGDRLTARFLGGCERSISMLDLFNTGAVNKHYCCELRVPTAALASSKSGLSAVSTLLRSTKYVVKKC